MSSLLIPKVPSSASTISSRPRLIGAPGAIQFELDGIPYRTGLTEIETYFIPLGLVLIYIVFSWAWKRLFGSGDDDQDEQENG